MATPSLAFNPLATTNAAGLFNVSSDGLVQGVYMDAPNTRYNLAGGVLASAATLPVWGGVGIQEKISSTGINITGNDILQATAQTNLTGFSVFNQNGAGMNSPQSPVPVVGTGMQVNFFRLGSGAQICLAIDPALVSLDGGLITQQVSWDYTNQKIVAYDSTAALPVKILQVQTSGCKTVAYNSGTGVATWVYSSNAVALVII